MIDNVYILIKNAEKNLHTLLIHVSKQTNKFMQKCPWDDLSISKKYGIKESCMRQHKNASEILRKKKNKK